MEVPPLVSETDRLAALDDYSVLDTPAEPGFDDVVALATQLCRAPVALVSLVARDRQWFKANVGFPACETDLDRSVCVHALGASDLLVVPDLTLDARTRANPLVTGEPRIRFYAGAPLVTSDGHALGSLCVIDHVPRPAGLTPSEADGLRRLARQVMSLLELRKAVAARDEAIAGERRGRALATADARRLEALIATQRVAASASADLATIFQAIVDGALAVVDAANGAAIEMREGEDLVYRNVSGALVPHVDKRLPLRGTMSGYALKTGEACICADAETDDRVDAALARSLGIRSMIAMPVSREGVAIGVLKVQSAEPNAFAPRDVLMARMLAGLVASGLNQAAEAEARTALRNAEDRYKAVFDSAIDFAIVTADAEGTITDWNPGAEQIMGWRRDEVRGRPLDTFFVPEDVEAQVAEREMDVALDRGSAKDERWHERRTGERFWALGRMMTLRHEDGSLRGFLKILQDRTPQRRAEEALRFSENRYRSLYDSIDAGFCVIEMAFDANDHPVDYRILEVNPSFGPQTGLADVVGRMMRDLVPEHEQYWFDIYARVARTRQPQRFEQYAGALGKRWFEVYAYPVGDTVTPNVAVLFNDISNRKRVERALMDSETRWRGLFTGMQEGFFVGEMIRDADGRSTDYRFVEINPAFAAQSGLPEDSAGRTMKELVPDIPQWLVDLYGEVVDTGEPRLFEIQVPELRRWFEVRARKDSGQRFACLFLDVTERKEAEVRRAAAVEVGDRLRDVTDKAEVGPTVAEILGRTLDLVHAGYGEVDGKREVVTIAGGWSATGLPSLDGLHHFREYGTYIDDLKAGRTALVSDVETDPRTSADFRSLDAIGARALANLPILQHGRLVALFYAVKGEPHEWTEEEVAFLYNVADRAQSTVARLDAEAQRHVLNEELSHRLKNTLAMVQAIATQTLRSVPERAPVEAFERRVQALANAHDVLLRQSWAAAPARTVVEAVLGTAASLDRFDLSGPDMALGPRATLSLSLVLHELATNASKYGALSGEAGRVSLTWRRETDDHDDLFVLRWRESGGPPVIAPERKGFGSRLIRAGLVGSGDVDLRYPVSGFEADIRAPLVDMQRS